LDDGDAGATAAIYRNLETSKFDFSLTEL